MERGSSEASQVRPEGRPPSRPAEQEGSLPSPKETQHARGSQVFTTQQLTGEIEGTGQMPGHARRGAAVGRVQGPLRTDSPSSEMANFWMSHSTTSLPGGGGRPGSGGATGPASSRAGPQALWPKASSSPTAEPPLPCSRCEQRCPGPAGRTRDHRGACQGAGLLRGGEAGQGHSPVMAWGMTVIRRRWLRTLTPMSGSCMPTTTRSICGKEPDLRPGCSQDGGGGSSARRPVALRAARPARSGSEAEAGPPGPSEQPGRDRRAPLRTPGRQARTLLRQGSCCRGPPRGRSSLMVMAEAGGGEARSSTADDLRPRSPSHPLASRPGCSPPPPSSTLLCCHLPSGPTPRPSQPRPTGSFSPHGRAPAHFRGRRRRTARSRRQSRELSLRHPEAGAPALLRGLEMSSAPFAGGEEEETGATAGPASQSARSARALAGETLASRGLSPVGPASLAAPTRRATAGRTETPPRARPQKVSLSARRAGRQACQRHVGGLRSAFIRVALARRSVRVWRRVRGSGSPAILRAVFRGQLSWRRRQRGLPSTAGTREPPQGAPEPEAAHEPSGRVGISSSLGGARAESAGGGPALAGIGPPPLPVRVSVIEPGREASGCSPAGPWKEEPTVHLREARSRSWAAPGNAPAAACGLQGEAAAASGGSSHFQGHSHAGISAGAFGQGALGGGDLAIASKPASLKSSSHGHTGGGRACAPGGRGSPLSSRNWAAVNQSGE